MPIYHHPINLSSVFDNLKRPQHVLIVLQNQDGAYLLASKPKYYPSGIYRFAGGGVKRGETPNEAVIREFQEEVGFAPEQEKLQPLAQIITSGELNNKHYQNTTYLYSYSLSDKEQVKPGDDITDLHALSQDELQELINHYYSLGKDDWLLEKGKKVHCWHDYGQMYGFIHQVALDLTKY